MQDNIFKARMSNRIIKIQYVAGNMGVAVAMPNNNRKDVYLAAIELSSMIIHEKLNTFSTMEEVI